MSYLTYDPLLTCFVAAAILFFGWACFEAWRFKRNFIKSVHEARARREREDAILQRLHPHDPVLTPEHIDAEYRTWFKNIKEMQ